MSDAEVRDRLAINELYGRYVFALEGDDPEALGRCFTEDAVFEHRAGRLAGREAIGSLVTTLARSANRAFHIVSSVVILRLDSAKGDASSTARWISVKPIDGALNFGTYLDSVVRCADGQWRFAEHHVRALRQRDAGT